MNETDKINLGCSLNLPNIFKIKCLGFLMEESPERNECSILKIGLEGVEYDIMYLLRELEREGEYSLTLKKRVDIYQGKDLRKQEAIVTFKEVRRN